MIRKIKKAYKRYTRPKYENCIEAYYSIALCRKIFGVSVYTVKSAPGGHIYAKFTYLGFISFIFWYFTYFCCVYKIYSSDQTILRSLYNTKLKRYGDEVERVSSTIFVLYTMWKLPFDDHLDVHYMQLLVDIDKAIESLGVSIQFSKVARTSYITVIFTITMSASGALATWLSLGSLQETIPLAKLFQVMYSDAMVLVTTARYCGYLYLLASRYKILNKLIAFIDPPQTRNILFEIGGKNTGRISNTLRFHDEHINERLRRCGKIYGMLYDATETANRRFGLSLALTMLLCLIFIVLYLFYFMEATAFGLFHDPQRYVNFLIYVFRQIVFSLGAICFNIYFSENTVNQAKVTSFVTHNVINSEVNPIIRTEALHLSLQIMHQRPVFTARGLCKIDYMLLLDGTRAVVTFLVILIQFATK